jgi:hypothetical protein
MQDIVAGMALMDAQGQHGRIVAVEQAKALAHSVLRTSTVSHIRSTLARHHVGFGKTTTL